MLLFLDTEFTDFTSRGLISIGLISSDGSKVFYGELTDFDYEACSGFVRSHVWKHLGRYPKAKMKSAELASALSAWFATITTPIVLACDSEVDRALLINAFGAEHRPAVLDILDLRPMLSTPCAKRSLKLFQLQNRPVHHALYDAQSLRFAWLACETSDREAGLSAGATGGPQ